MSKFEKILIMSSLAGVGLAGVYSVLSNKAESAKKEDLMIIRERLVKDPQIKILYSTMTFFYLQGFEQRKLDSFYKFYDILGVAKPKFIALPISAEEY